MAPVLDRVRWSRAASRLQLQLALLPQQCRYGNPLDKLDVYRWSVLHWVRYRALLQV